MLVFNRFTSKSDKIASLNENSYFNRQTEFIKEHRNYEEQQSIRDRELHDIKQNKI